MFHKYRLIVSKEKVGIGRAEVFDIAISVDGLKEDWEDRGWVVHEIEDTDTIHTFEQVLRDGGVLNMFDEEK